jgi:lipopolysaccharide/colanic/teichoic acid biosynthesis glycosyltransferase
MAKRFFDLLLALIGLLAVGWLLLIFWIVVSIDTQSNGLFIQERVGQWGGVFRIYKLKTMHPATATISQLGSFLRKTKIDELPQLWNVLKGDMSFVGPRPDVAGYYDVLQGEARKILELKPGITSAASIKYQNEERLLEQQDNPLHYNDTVLFPDKVQMNLAYYYNRSFLGDIHLIWKTVFSR